MNNLEDQNGVTIQHRTGDNKPGRTWRTWLIGRPLPTADAPHQTIGRLIGLAIFASDALSSTAYATQESMLVLAAAAAFGAFQYAFPISIAIVILLIILTFSYEQTIHSYPGGGGAYIVARDNLGELPAQAAGASLLTDYILTVAVSISSGVAQLVSAFPAFFPYRVCIAVVLVMFIMIINLRGVKESGSVFAIPTYFFIVTMFLTVGVGMVRFFIGNLGTVVDPPPMDLAVAAQGISVFLILRSFAGGTTALTGIEAISNGITAFKEPRSKLAGQTLIMMSTILGTLLLAITFLANRIGSVPSSEGETIISQLARTIFDGRGPLYLALIAGTTIILMMGANTSFAGFPRLSALQAIDGYLPRQLAYRGSRLVYSRGIVFLAVCACGLIIIFSANVTRLIPLYAIGVFLSFTLSQAGMARRWWKIGHMKSGAEKIEQGSTVKYESGWQHKMVINGFGAVSTMVVTLVFAVTKFHDGAWVVVFLIPALMAIFMAIHRHYRGLAKNLSLDHYGAPPPMSRQRVILTIGGVHRGSLAALRFARSLTDDITAVHVSIDPVEAEKIQKKWEIWGEGIRLVVLESPYRLFLEPLIEYIEEIDTHRSPNEVLTIVVPQFVSRHWWNNFLHTRTAEQLRTALILKKDIVITDVPYQVN
jgi:amino acid transporter